MTLTIELSPQTEQQLRATAEANGQQLQNYIQEILDREAQENAEDVATAKQILETSDPTQYKTLAQLQQAIDAQARLKAIQEFNEAAQAIAPTLPVLSAHATSREGIYEGLAEHALRHT